MNTELKPILINFDTLKKGDKLYHSALGEVEVNGLNNDILYPIEIIYYNDFVGGFTILNFMKNGTFSHDCKSPSLFTENPFAYLTQACNAIKDEWVDVNERLPDEHEKVLVLFGEIDNVLMGKHTTGNKWLVYFSDGEKLNDSPNAEIITHWMPLPQNTKL